MSVRPEPSAAHAVDAFLASKDLDELGKQPLVFAPDHPKFAIYLGCFTWATSCLLAGLPAVFCLQSHCSPSSHLGGMAITVDNELVHIDNTQVGWCGRAEKETMVIPLKKVKDVQVVHGNCASGCFDIHEVSIATDYATAGVGYEFYGKGDQDWPRIGMLGMSNPDKVANAVHHAARLANPTSQIMHRAVKSVIAANRIAKAKAQTQA